MVSGKLKSRSMRRIAKRTPGGRNTIHYVRKRPSPPVCGGCGAPLHGVGRMTTTQARTTSKSRKRPERPHGGVLCSACSRRIIISNTRKDTGQAQDTDQNGGREQ